MAEHNGGVILTAGIYGAWQTNVSNCKPPAREIALSDLKMSSAVHNLQIDILSGQKPLTQLLRHTNLTSRWPVEVVSPQGWIGLGGFRYLAANIKGLT